MSGSKPRPSSPSRRDFLKGVGGLAATAALGRARSAQGAEPTRPPNIVLIVADDFGQECMPVYGGSSYVTPALDALAAGGMRFDHCYSTPWCAPSRVQLLTGLYPLRNFEAWGTFDPGRNRSFGHVLSEAGYATATAGKWQLCRFHEPGQADHPQRAGFQQSSLWTWWFEDEHSGEVRPKYWDPWIWQNGALRDDTAGRYGPDVFVEFLTEFMTRKRDDPFFVYYPMLLPHKPFVSTPESGLMVRGLSQLPQAVRARYPGPIFTDYVRYLDRCVERVVAALDRSGKREETLILFTSDNGTDKKIHSTFRGRSVAGGKGSLVDAGIRVPLLASWPGRVPAGSVSPDLVDLSDFLPTLAELAGTATPAGLDGRSFLPQLLGRPGNPREWIYAESFYWERDGRAVRSRDWKLLDDGQLFDMREDPYEARPVASGSGGAEAREARERLEAALARVDRGPLGSSA